MTGDQFPVRVVVLTLAAAVLMALAGVLFLSFTQTAIPDALDRALFIALGAIGGILAKTSTGEAVRIDNATSDPVPVAEQPPAL